MALDPQIEETAHSGVRPLELRYQTVVDTYTKAPLGYLTETVVHSMDLGTLKQNDFAYATEMQKDIGCRLSEWNIDEVLRHIKRFDDAHGKISFITAKCSPNLVEQEDLFERLRSAVEKADIEKRNTLCLEFPVSLLYRQDDRARNAVLDLKALGVSTMISGVDVDSPISKLMTIPVDYVFVAPSMTPLLTDRNKPDVFANLLKYIGSMNAKALVSDISSDDENALLTRMECIGFTASDSYDGHAVYTERDISLDEALAQKEDA